MRAPSNATARPASRPISQTCACRTRPAPIVSGVNRMIALVEAEKLAPPSVASVPPAPSRPQKEEAERQRQKAEAEKRRQQTQQDAQRQADVGGDAGGASAQNQQPAPAAVPAGADDSRKFGCLGCHAIAEKKVGPAYKDIAAKYKNMAYLDAEALLVGKLKNGKGHMKVAASDAELKSVVNYALSAK